MLPACLFATACLFVIISVAVIIIIIHGRSLWSTYL
jgi:hypothetical protein